MAFTIHALLSSDLPEAFAIGDKAFSNFNPILYNTYPPSRESLERLTTMRIEVLTTVTQGTMFKAVDSVTGKMIGAARWLVCEEDQVIDGTVEEAVQATLGLFVPEMNRSVIRGFYTMVSQTEREILGLKQDGKVCKLRKRVELETLFVHPEYQHHGVGTALLAWGVEEADRLGLMMYLEATEDGRPLYERFGFRNVKVMEFDAPEFGGEGVVRYTFMVREPNTSPSVMN